MGIQMKLLSLLFGILSAVFWTLSSVIRSRVKPHRVIITMEDKKDDVDLHNLILTIQAQSLWNRLAAFSASLAIIFQMLE